MRDGNIFKEGRQHRRFISLFGITPEPCPKIRPLLPKIKNGRPKQLLWALVFLKIYSNNHVQSNLANCNELTFRKWPKLFIEQISKVPMGSSKFLINYVINTY